MRVLVTGTEGYIGRRLAPYLVHRGHVVRGLDTGFYRDGWLYSSAAAEEGVVESVSKDLRRLSAADFDGVDAVLHLAELSNDPLGENKPEVTYQINHQGSVRMAELAKAAGVRRFVYASSCSVYGVGTGEFLDEASPVNPQTAYARCKVLVEQDVAKLADAAFCVVFLRNSTAYGPSPRMRFDIVLNDLCARALTTHTIAMTSDGTPWRPVVHVEDICQAFACALEAPADAVNGEIFNVGSTAENYRIRELAEIVAAEFPGCEVERRAEWRRQPQLPSVVRQDRDPAARVRLPLDRAPGCRRAASPLQAHRVRRGDASVPCLYAAEAVALSFVAPARSTIDSSGSRSPGRRCRGERVALGTTQLRRRPRPSTH